MFSRISVISLTLLATTVSMSGHAAELLKPYNALYKVARNDIGIGKLTFTLARNDQGAFVYESTRMPNAFVSLFKPDVIKERSQCRLQNGSIQPLNYSYSQTGGSKERFVNMTFDWQTNRVTNHVNNKPWSMSIPDNTQDKLGYLLAIMLDVSRGKTSMSYHIADGGKLKTYDIRVIGEETLLTSSGKIDTVMIKRILPKKKKRSTVIWLAKQLGYLPVKIQQNEKNDVVYSMTLTSLNNADIRLQQ